MIICGILLGLVGTDVNSGVMRYAFGVPELSDGLALPVIAMALFGVSEMIESVGKVESSMIDPKAITLKSMVPTRDDVKRAWKPILRGSLVGSIFGPLPGTGALVSCFGAYAIEKKLADDPSRFGKGGPSRAWWRQRRQTTPMTRPRSSRRCRWASRTMPSWRCCSVR